MIAFACTKCQSSLKVEPQGPGQKVKCPRCLAVVLVPQPVAVTGDSEGSLPSSQDEARSDSSTPSIEETVAGAAPSHPAEVPEEIASLLAPARGGNELGWLGPYRVLKILGHGGMGVVFHAEDPQLGRAVALKAILPRYASNRNARERFIREARAAAGLKHDHIVAIYQVGEDRGIPYQAMEYLEGQSLDQYLKRKKRVPLPEALRIARDIASGLAEAHGRGLIHRDIKPANIWLEKKKETAAGLAAVRVKILDFGLARDAKEDTNLTQMGTIVGTPAYMAPEQAKGHPVDHRSDLFSLGCLLYKLSTGRLPFRGDNTLAILSSLATETPEPPESLCADMPIAVGNFISKLLEKDPEDRPASARETAETLQRLLREVKQAAKAAPASDPEFVLIAPRRSWDPRAIRWWWWAAAGAGIVALLLAIALRPRDDIKKDVTPDAPLKTTPKNVPPTEAPLPGDDTLFGRLKQKNIPAEDLAWAFGTSKKVPREVVGLVRNRSTATGEARLSGFALSPDSRWLATGGPGLQVETHDFATGAARPGTRSSHAVGYVFSLGKNALTSAGPASITNRNLLTGEEAIAYSSPGGVAATAFAGNAEGTYFFMGTAEGKIHILNSLNWKRMEILSAHSGPVAGLLIRPDGKKLVSADAEGNVTVWAALIGKSFDNPRQLPKVPDPLPPTVFPKDRGKLRQIAFGPGFGNTLLAAFEGSQSIHAVNLDRKTALSPFAVGIEIAAFALAADGKTLATISPSGQLRLWDFAQSRRLAEIALPPVGDDGYGPMQFAPDGNHLLIGIPRGAVAIVRVG